MQRGSREGERSDELLPRRCCAQQTRHFCATRQAWQGMCKVYCMQHAVSASQRLITVVGSQRRITCVTEALDVQYEYRWTVNLCVCL